MSRCKLRTPSPIHFKLRTVIGIDSLYWFLKKCCFQLYKYCINVPIHVYGAAVGEIKIFHSRVMGKKVFTNIIWMLTTGVSCALGAAVYYILLCLPFEWRETYNIVLVWFFLLPPLPLLLSEACPDHNFFVFPDRSMIFGLWVHDHKAVCRVP
jgi:hypothetical protein